MSAVFLSFRHFPILLREAADLIQNGFINLSIIWLTVKQLSAGLCLNLGFQEL